jgi:hypothetical protein
MNNSTLVEILKPQYDFSDVLLRPLFGERAQGLDESCTINGDSACFIRIMRSALTIRDLVLRNHISLFQNFDSVTVSSSLLREED